MSKIIDANMKLPQETIIMLKKINHRLVYQGFDNIKVLNAMAIVDLKKLSDRYTTEEFYAYVITRVEELQRQGIVNDDARSVGNESKKRQKLKKEQELRKRERELREK